MTETSAYWQLLRVSVATLNRVIFTHPASQVTLLALEHKATVAPDGAQVHVRAQPFGGAVRILDSQGLAGILDRIVFDSQRSTMEQDLRLLIPAGVWPQVRQYCLAHLANPLDAQLEAHPHRELGEEFLDAMDVQVHPDQYSIRPIGFTIEDTPVPTDNQHAPGRLTVRIYRTFEVQIIDPQLSETMWRASQRYSDAQLGQLALDAFQKGMKGRANSLVALPYTRVVASWLAAPRDERYRPRMIDGYRVDESVLAVLDGIEVPQLQYRSD